MAWLANAAQKAQVPVTAILEQILVSVLLAFQIERMSSNQPWRECS